MSNEKILLQSLKFTVIAMVFKLFVVKHHDFNVSHKILNLEILETSLSFKTTKMKYSFSNTQKAGVLCTSCFQKRTVNEMV